MLINSWQYTVAKYFYDAFGNTLYAAGSLAQANVYRYSSKETHPNSGLVYYLYRYYDPNLQRWLNRDPIAERGGVNLYLFVNNKPTVNFDGFGLIDIEGPPDPGPLTPCAAAKLATQAAFEAAEKPGQGPLQQAATEAALVAAYAAEQVACGQNKPPSTPPQQPFGVCPRPVPVDPTLNQTQSFCQQYPGVCIGVPVAVGIGILGFLTGGLGWTLYAL